MKIFTSTNHLKMHGPNSSFGNHVQHFFAVYCIAKKLNIPFRISTDSNLDDMFDLDEYKEYHDVPLLFAEEWGGNVEEYFLKECRNYQFVDNLIDGKIKAENDFKIEGWFWNSKLIPSESFFDEIKIKPFLLNEVNKKSHIFEDTSLVLHYRGTDFKYHTIGWGDLRLQGEYYKKCIDHFRKEQQLKKLVVITDESNNIFKFGDDTDFEIIVEKNNYLIDWLILLFCKNLICSNSTFCNTSGWYRKNIVYQPSKFFTRYLNTDIHFPPNPYYKDSIVL